MILSQKRTPLLSKLASKLNSKSNCCCNGGDNCVCETGCILPEITPKVNFNVSYKDAGSQAKQCCRPFVPISDNDCIETTSITDFGFDTLNGNNLDFIGSCLARSTDLFDGLDPIESVSCDWSPGPYVYPYMSSDVIAVMSRGQSFYGPNGAFQWYSSTFEPQMGYFVTHGSRYIYNPSVRFIITKEFYGAENGTIGPGAHSKLLIHSELGSGNTRILMSLGSGNIVQPDCGDLCFSDEDCYNMGIVCRKQIPYAVTSSASGTCESGSINVFGNINFQPTIRCPDSNECSQTNWLFDFNASLSGMNTKICEEVDNFNRGMFHNGDIGTLDSPPSVDPRIINGNQDVILLLEKLRELLDLNYISTPIQPPGIGRGIGDFI